MTDQKKCSPLNESIEAKLARIAEEAEAGEEDQAIEPIPSHIKVTRGPFGSMMERRKRRKGECERLARALYDALNKGYAGHASYSGYTYVDDELDLMVIAKYLIKAGATFK